MLNRLLKLFGRAAKAQEPPADALDPRRLIERRSVEEFNAAAENYFRQQAGHAAFFLKKPLGEPRDAACQLAAFAAMLDGLKPLPGMRLLDFGAGSCWAARYFADFKLDVVACDVSPAALELGRQRFALQPVLDSPFRPEFLAFNGRELALPDASLDRIACFDALHCVPNLRETLRELARALKEGGIAGFSEPGPGHSQTPQSQFQMRHHGLLENDIVLETLWTMAREAGFTELRVAVFNTAPFTLSLEEFARLGQPGSQPLKAYAEHVRRHAAERRLFFLHKGQPGTPDSRAGAGLACALTIALDAHAARPGEPISGLAHARNTGTARWLPSDAQFGPVKLGVHLHAADGTLLDYDFARAALPGGRAVEPGEAVAIPFRFGAPARSGDYILAFDLVSEDVCWFEALGSPPARINAAVD